MCEKMQDVCQVDLLPVDRLEIEYKLFESTTQSDDFQPGKKKNGKCPCEARSKR